MGDVLEPILINGGLMKIRCRHLKTIEFSGVDLTANPDAKTTDRDSYGSVSAKPRDATKPRLGGSGLTGKSSRLRVEK